MIDEELVLKMARAFYGARGVFRTFLSMNMEDREVKRLSPNSVTNLVLGNAKGKVYVSPNQSCHAGLQLHEEYDDEVEYFKDGVVKYILSGIQAEFREEDKSNVEKFYSWLINDSPWQKVFLTRNGEEAVESGFLLARADVPSNLLASAMIASRLPTELDQGAKDWAFYVNQGASPALAFLCRHEFVRRTDGTIAPGGMIGHTCYKSTMMSKSEIDKFIGGTIPNQRHYLMNYDEIMYYRDVDVLLSEGEGESGVFKRVLKRVSEQTESSSVSTNPFANPSSTSVSIKQEYFPQFVEELMAEVKRD